MADQSIWSGKWHLGHLSAWGNVTFEDGSVLTGYFVGSCLQVIWQKQSTAKSLKFQFD